MNYNTTPNSIFKQPDPRSEPTAWNTITWREQLIELGVVLIEVEYNGAGDSLESFAVMLLFNTDAPLLPKVPIEGIHPHAQPVLVEREWDDETRSPVSGQLMEVPERIFANMVGKPMADAFSDFLFNRAEDAGAAMNFNNDGSQGEIKWNLLTGEATVDSGYYETTRDDEGCIDNLFPEIYTPSEPESAAETP
jgi:hypothetical protein